MAENQRDGRCPDGGYCHGQSFAAGSDPCPEGECYRVRNAGPLSGVFPGDRWPDDVLAAHGAPDGRRDTVGATQLGRIDAELLVCTRCVVKPEEVPLSSGRHIEPDVPAIVYIDQNTHRLVVVPHRPDCPQLDEDTRKARRFMVEAGERTS